MKFGKSWWKMPGLILWESIAFIDLGIDLYTGKMNTAKLVLILTICLVVAIVLRNWFRKNRQR